MTVHKQLLGAVLREELFAVFQPQIDVATGRVVAAEALSRWQHPERGEVNPDEYIPSAESTGLISQIGQFMFELGCRTALDWRAQGTDLEVAINVSARQLSERSYFSRIIDVLAGTGIDGSQLILEITESNAIADFSFVGRGLDQLRAEGIGISIDDFGTGHSNLALLDVVPATEVKFDKSLVQSDDHAALEAALESIRSKGLRTVAEGVETTAHLERITRLGFDRAQGYYISRPVPADRIPALVALRA